MKNILFFDIEKLERHTKCDPAYIIYALTQKLDKIYLPKRSNSKYKPIPLLSGNSFLLNAKDILASKCDIIWIAQYIRLAGRRSYTDYVEYNQTYLDLSLYPDLDRAAIKKNPLLEIVGNKLYFKLEDKNGTVIQKH